jgi:hypothetical protein
MVRKERSQGNAIPQANGMRIRCKRPLTNQRFLWLASRSLALGPWLRPGPRLWSRAAGPGAADPGHPAGAPGRIRKVRYDNSGLWPGRCPGGTHSAGHHGPRVAWQSVASVRAASATSTRAGPRGNLLNPSTPSMRRVSPVGARRRLMQVSLTRRTQLASSRTTRSQCRTLSHRAWTGSRSSLPWARSSSGDTPQPPSTP